jgi:hypothetical protein
MSIVKHGKITLVNQEASLDIDGKELSVGKDYGSDMQKWTEAVLNDLEKHELQKDFSGHASKCIKLKNNFSH